MKRILIYMGAAFTLAGILQPTTNIPKIPEAHATHVVSVMKPSEAVQAPVSPQEAEVVTDTAIEEPAVAEPYVAPQPILPLSEAEAKAKIYEHESGNRTDAINASSGACGIGQALPCSKLPCSLSNYACQDDWFTNNYMIPRYGSWVKAWEFWNCTGTCYNNYGPTVKTGTWW